MAASSAGNRSTFPLLQGSALPGRHLLLSASIFVTLHGHCEISCHFPRGQGARKTQICHLCVPLVVGMMQQALYKARQLDEQKMDVSEVPVTAMKYPRPLTLCRKGFTYSFWGLKSQIRQGGHWFVLECNGAWVCVSVCTSPYVPPTMHHYPPHTHTHRSCFLPVACPRDSTPNPGPLGHLNYLNHSEEPSDRARIYIFTLSISPSLQLLQAQRS